NGGWNHEELTLFRPSWAKGRFCLPAGSHPREASRKNVRMLQYCWSPTMKETSGRQLTADGATLRAASQCCAAVRRRAPVHYHAAWRQSEGDQFMAHEHHSRPL